ncbi:PQQ-binding-like beta-propeller repeat protein [Virgibacillus oceani]
MKKLAISIFVAALMFLAACSSDGNNNEQPENSPNESNKETEHSTENQNENNESKANKSNDQKEAIEAAGPFDPNQDIGGFMEGAYDENAIFPTDANWTRQSRFTGPEEPELIWSVETTDKEYTERPGRSSPVIGSDGTIYYISNAKDEEHDGLFAISPSGEVKWEVTDFHEELDVGIGNHHRSAPIIDENGDIWVRLDNDTFALFNGENGDLKDSFVWQTNLGSRVYPTVLGENGTFYINNGGIFGAVQDGDLKWEYGDEENISEHAIKGGPAVASDGTVYGIGKEAFYAIDETGKVKWENEIDEALDYSNIQIDHEGNVYFVNDTTLYSYSKHGDKRWEENVENEYYGSNGLTLTNDKKIVALFEDGLHAFNLDGNEEWHFQPNGKKASGSMIVDQEGTFYMNSLDIIYAVDSTGKLKWEYEPEGEDIIEYSNMVLGPDNTLYFFAHKGTMLAIGEK